MKNFMSSHHTKVRWLMFGFLMSYTSVAWGFGSSGDTTKPSTTGNFPQNPNGGWFIGDTEDTRVPIFVDPTKGPWDKTLQSSTGGNLMGVNPGTRIRLFEGLVIERLPNWTDWHEQILTPGWDWVVPPVGAPKFTNESAGGVDLAAPPNNPPTHTAPTATQGGQLDFSFAPLTPGTRIDIDKQLVFQGSTPFTGTITVREFPTIPSQVVSEPASLILLVSGLASLGAVARQRHRQR